MNAKEAAARRAVEAVKSGMIIGLGSGSTATFAIQALAERMHKEELNIAGVPTSIRSSELAEELGIPIKALFDLGEIDMTIDGADEVNPDFHLIKGGGGALLREKIVAAASKERVVICDESKMVPQLGKFPLPVALAPFGWRTTLQRLRDICPNLSLRSDKTSPSLPFVSDDGMYVADLPMESIADPAALEQQIKAILGVVEVGLFISMATRIVVGKPDGTTKIIETPGMR
jgi:ribose 5-phosphate isomerase A